MNEPAFKAHLEHESEERRDYERDMLFRLGGPPRRVTSLSRGYFRLLAAFADTTTEPR